MDEKDLDVCYNHHKLIKLTNKIKIFCTNIDQVKQETGLDITTEEGAMMFRVNYVHPMSCFPEKDYFRIVRIRDKYTYIDEPIADLIIELNEKGFETMYCCCGHNIEYRTRNNLGRFYIVFKFGEKNYKLMSSVMKKLTGVKSDKYSKRAMVLENINPKTELNRIIKNVTLEKREDNFNEYEVNGRKYKADEYTWQQSIGIRYYKKNREQAIDIIKTAIKESIK